MDGVGEANRIRREVVILGVVGGFHKGVAEPNRDFALELTLLRFTCVAGVMLGVLGVVTTLTVAWSVTVLFRYAVMVSLEFPGANDAGLEVGGNVMVVSLPKLAVELSISMIGGAADVD